MITSVLQMNTATVEGSFFLTYVCISKLGLGGFHFIPRSDLSLAFSSCLVQPPGDSLNTRQHVWGMP